MRFGRILLAILAPLLSVSPALKADVMPESHAPAIDSLLSLLRSVSPESIADAGSGHVRSIQLSHSAPPFFRHFVLKATLEPLASAAQAQIHRLLLQQQRTLLRC
jgi:hypothetical protein